MTEPYWPEGYVMDRELYELAMLDQPKLTLLTPTTDVGWYAATLCLRAGHSIWAELPDAPEEWTPDWRMAMYEARLDARPSWYVANLYA